RLLFFFQAEDGIRDDLVTGVQTCALPIWPARGDAGARCRGGCCGQRRGGTRQAATEGLAAVHAERQRVQIGTLLGQIVRIPGDRSEERRVGKEWRCRWLADD